MANASRWSLSARQGFLVCGSVVAGLFMLSCGTGMSNIPIAALGVAIGLLGPAVITLSSIRANRPDVFGTAHVSQSSPPPPTGVTGRADLHLVVNAQGVRNAVVRIRDARVPVSKWPDIGANLPVLIPNGNPRRLQILWDQVRAHHDLAMDDVSYTPYVEEDYVDEGASYAAYPLDEPFSPAAEPFADSAAEPAAEPATEAFAEPVTVDEQAERRSAPQPRSEWARPGQPEHGTEPAPDTEAARTEEIPVSAGVTPGPSAAPVSPASGTAPGPDAVTTTAPARRRPSPRPRRRTEPPDSVEAVVPMATPASEVVAPVVPPATRSDVVEAKPAVPAAVERMDPVVPAGAVFIGSTEGPPPADVAKPADTVPADAADAAPADTAPAEAAEAGATGPAATEPADVAEPGGAEQGAAERDEPVVGTGAAGPTTVEFTLTRIDPSSAQPPDTETEASVPLPRRVPGSSGHRPGRDPVAREEAAQPADDEPDATGAGASGPDAEADQARPTPYLASYLADEPEDERQGLSGVHNVSVTVIVSDLRRSLTFYRDLLGLTEIDGGMGSAILVSGNARILLRQVADTRPVDRRVVHLNLEVDDVHEAYERLRREGVEFMHPPRVVSQGEQLEQWAATLRDPDGHAIALTHWEVRP